MIQLELYELKNMCMYMAELGAANYAKLFMPAKDNMSQRAAYREYGVARVKRWTEHGLIHTVRSGSKETSKILYSRCELMACDKAEFISNLINK